MEETATYTQFVDQAAPQLTPKELLDFAKKNLKIFGEIEQKQFKRLEAQLKYEEKVDKKNKENRDLQTRRQKELDDINDKNFKEELDRAKTQKENFEKLKNLSVSELIPSRVQDIGRDRFNPDNENPNKRFFEKISSTLELIPEKIQKTVRKPQDEKGEQKNLGEDILKVSFHREGIKILKDLLNPIYEALKANTEALDKLLKKATEERGGGGVLGWLLAIAGAVFVLFEQIYKRIKGVMEIFEAAKTRFWQFIDDLFKLPDTIRDVFNRSRLVQWLKEKWTKVFDTVKDLGLYIKSYWDEFIVNPFKEKWANFISKAKETIRFDELADAFKVKWTSWMTNIKNIFSFDTLTQKVTQAKNGLSSAWDEIKKVLDGFTDGIKSGYDKVKNAFDGFKNLFSEEGIIGKLISKIKIAFDGLKNSFDNVLQFLNPLWDALRQAGSFIKPVLKFLGWFLIILDPLVAAGKTLFNVWNNENLTFFEKSIAVLTSAFFGLGDGIASLIGIVSEGVTGLWNFITGNGWKTENPVGNFMRGMTKDYSFGGMGETMGGHAALAMQDSAEDLALNKPDFDPTQTPKYKKLQELKKDGLTLEEEEYLDTNFDEKGQPVDDFIMQPKGISSLIVDRANNQMYQTAPNDEIMATKKGGIIDQSLQDLKSIMSEVNKNILRLNSRPNESQSPTIINNSTVMGGKENKEYLFKPMFDVNADKRSSWWMVSREFQTGT